MLYRTSINWTSVSLVSWHCLSLQQELHTDTPLYSASSISQQRNINRAVEAGGLSFFMVCQKCSMVLLQSPTQSLKHYKLALGIFSPFNMGRTYCASFYFCPFLQCRADCKNMRVCGDWSKTGLFRIIVPQSGKIAVFSQSEVQCSQGNLLI